MPEVKISCWQRLVGLEKRLLLVDGTGALVSTGMIGGVLANYPAVVGMPRNVLLFLASLAVGFAVYSFSCYWWAGKRWRSFLRVIAFVNIAYGLFTFTLLCWHYEALQLLGVAYFFTEIAVLIALARIEFAAAVQ